MTGPVLILGHSGFIGGAIAEYLQRCHPEISVLKPPRLDLTDQKASAELAPWITPDSTVILCAAVKKQLGDNLETFQANLAMAENLCLLFAQRPPARVLYFSSAAVFGEKNSNLAITEETLVDPSTYYGIGKYTTEKLLEITLSDRPTSLAILRPPLIYGAGDTSRGYGPTGFAWNALHCGGSITLWGEGDELREFVFIEDAARIAGELALLDFAGIVNLASGTSHSFRQALEQVSRHRPVTMDTQPRSKTQIDQAYDNSRLRALLPDLAFTSLEEGISRTMNLLAAREAA